MEQTPVSVIAFLARMPGLLCLKALVEESAYRVHRVYTHRQKPKSEDPARSERPEFQEFEKICRQFDIDLVSIETHSDATQLVDSSPPNPVDLVLSCSYRFKIPMTLVNSAKRGSVNLHRGKLPNYKGAEPVKRALENGDAEITLTAHAIEADYDTGRTILERVIPVDRSEGESISDAVTRLKIELYPLYPKALLDACEILRCNPN